MIFLSVNFCSHKSTCYTYACTELTWARNYVRAQILASSVWKLTSCGPQQVLNVKTKIGNSVIIKTTQKSERSLWNMRCNVSKNPVEMCFHMFFLFSPFFFIIKLKNIYHVIYICSTATTKQRMWNVVPRLDMKKSLLLSVSKIFFEKSRICRTVVIKKIGKYSFWELQNKQKSLNSREKS